MNNPILDKLNNSFGNNMIGNLQRMIDTNAPQYKQAMEIVRQNDGDAQKAFYALAKQYGIDPQEILKMIK